MRAGVATLAKLGMLREDFEVFVIEYGRKPIDQFLSQWAGAKFRGVGWELTFPEWWEIWQNSGKYHLRGHCRGQYVMARNWDAGPYAVGNVDIQLVRENARTVEYRRQFAKVRTPSGGRTYEVASYPKEPLEILLEEEAERELAKTIQTAYPDSLSGEVRLEQTQPPQTTPP